LNTFIIGWKKVLGVQEGKINFSWINKKEKEKEKKIPSQIILLIW
jgi:hypothetical protein